MTRFKLNDLIGLRNRVENITKQVDQEIYSKQDILGLCRLIKLMLEEIQPVLIPEEEKLYRTICDLYPSAFGRHDMARHFLKILKDTYRDDGSKKTEAERLKEHTDAQNHQSPA